MKTTLKTFLSISALSLAALTGCGGGGGGDDDPGSTGSIRIQGDFPSFAPYSEWSVTTDTTEDSCGDFERSYFDLIIEYNEGDNSATIMLEGDDGDAVSIQITANSESSITLSGRIEHDDDSVSTFTNLVLNFPLSDFIEGVTQLNGSVDWEWQDDTETCVGKSDVSGRLEVETETDPDPQPGTDIEGSIGTANVTIAGTQLSLPIYTAVDYEFVQGGYFAFGAVDDVPDNVNPSSQFSGGALGVVIAPFSGSGSYSQNSDGDQEVHVTISQWDFNGFNEVSSEECIDAGDADNDGLGASSASITVTKNGASFSGNGSGTLNCFDTTDGNDAYSGTKSFTLSFSLEIPADQT